MSDPRYTRYRCTPLTPAGWPMSKTKGRKPNEFDCCWVRAQTKENAQKVGLVILRSFGYRLRHKSQVSISEENGQGLGHYWGPMPAKK